MGFLIQLVLGQCMAGLGFMGLWQIQATLTELPELPFNNTLDWMKFSVIDSEGDVLVNNIQEQLLEIVKDIEDEAIIKLFSNLREVNNVQTSSPVEKASYSGVLI